MVKIPLKLPINNIRNDNKNAANFIEKGSISKHEGVSSWANFSKRSGLRRNAKNKKENRKRWDRSSDDHATTLRDNLFSPQQEDLIIKLHATIGSRWGIIAQQVEGRSETDVKTLWNNKLKKKLSSMGIDPVTHKPFSQILSDYVTMGSSSSSSSSSLIPYHHHHAMIDLHDQTSTINAVPDSSSPDHISSFSWSDFLLDEASDHRPDLRERDLGAVEEGKLGLTGSGSEEEEEEEAGDDCKKMDVIMRQLPAESSSCSFVEAMIKQQEAMHFSNDEYLALDHGEHSYYYYHL